MRLKNEIFPVKENKYMKLNSNRVQIEEIKISFDESNIYKIKFSKDFPSLIY